MATYQGGMTSDEANEIYQCERCEKEGSGACGFDCVLSSTCSFLCPECKRATFFPGNYEDAPEHIICVHCEHVFKNKFLKGRKW